MFFRRVPGFQTSWPILNRATSRQVIPAASGRSCLDEILFIESGRVTVRLNLPGGKTMRLRSMTTGTMIGEMGVYLESAAQCLGRRRRGNAGPCADCRQSTRHGSCATRHWPTRCTMRLPRFWQND